MASLPESKSQSAFSAAMCNIQARKCYIESLPSALKDKRSCFFHASERSLLLAQLLSGSTQLTINFVNLIFFNCIPNLWDNGLLLHEFHHHQGLHQLTVVYALREKEVAK